MHEPNIQWSRWAILAATQAHLGRLEDARRSIEALRALRPDVDLAFARDYWPIADANALEYLVDGLRRAGLPAVLVDFVAKVENRTTPKISRKVIFREL